MSGDMPCLNESISTFTRSFALWARGSASSYVSGRTPSAVLPFSQQALEFCREHCWSKLDFRNTHCRGPFSKISLFSGLRPATRSAQALPTLYRQGRNSLGPMMGTTRAQAGSSDPRGSGGTASETKQKYTLKSEGGGTYKVEGGQQINVATAGVHALVRLGSGAFVSGKLSEFRKRPKEPIILYEFDACPFCRKVREACSILDLDVLFYPCPKDGPNWRPKAAAMSGKGQFPFLVDPNTGKQMLESDAIINYLWNEYGDGQVPLQFKLGPLTTISIGIGLLARGGKGATYRKSNLPKEPIEIWGYEASPFVKLARECLVELELPHLYHSVARNSPKRPLLTEKWGSFQVPYIEDPNTGMAMFESSKIIEYLNDTYAVK